MKLKLCSSGIMLEVVPQQLSWGVSQTSVKYQNKSVELLWIYFTSTEKKSNIVYSIYK